ncbi:MAG: class I SAM-dependent methyltransferase [Methanospirillum hungatei]|nr:class I SAM-dependent methyltransferase [Methanospirillum hungatei]
MRGYALSSSVCERKSGERGLKLDLHFGDAETLLFPDNSFDVITRR